MKNSNPHYVPAILKTAMLTLVASLFAFGVSGCATILWGTTQNVEIRSTPSGADVFVSGKHKGKTPLEVEVPREKDFLNIVLKKEGYADTQVKLEDNFNPWTVPALVVSCAWGYIGIVADVRSAATSHYESEISVPLLKEKVSSPRCFNNEEVVVQRAENYR